MPPRHALAQSLPPRQAGILRDPLCLWAFVAKSKNQNFSNTHWSVLDLSLNYATRYLQSELLKFELMHYRSWEILKLLKIEINFFQLILYHV